MITGAHTLKQLEDGLRALDARRADQLYNERQIQDFLCSRFQVNVTL